MTWGMLLPNGFGQFWPYGEFEGWHQRLMSHYMAQPPEIQRTLYNGLSDPLQCAANYPFYVSQKLVSELGSRISPHPHNPPFTPVEDHEPPTIFVTEAKCKELGSLIALNDRIVAVDAAMRSLIEAFEPGVHRFFPIDIMMPKGARFERPFFILWIGQYRDCFVPSASNPEVFAELPDSGGQLTVKTAQPGATIKGLALARDQISGAHLWRERKFGEWLSCFSDELHQTIEDAGLLTPKMWRTRDA